MHSHSYLNTASLIIQSYDGSIPLTAWLKQFFRADKKFGSKDRKNISHACYCFYRLGRAFQQLKLEERMLTAIFLCTDSTNKILEELKPEWNKNMTLSIPEKIRILTGKDEIQNIFPFVSELSEEIEPELFNTSFLVQPDLFLRIRPGKEKVIVQQLQTRGVAFSLLSDGCIQLPNQSKVDELLNIDKDVVIQDYNSQKTIELIENSKLKTQNFNLSIWDCCAASGGKSILFHDHFPGAHLTVSDVRESILINLKKRFRRAGVGNFNHFIADVSSPGFSINKKFDLIICDAPCSGSGTWSRTPEQLCFFKQEKISHYAALQKKIAVNASKALKGEGHFLYITCSVFKKENEEVVEFIQKNASLQLKSMVYLKGYDKKADTLFAALFSRY